MSSFISGFQSNIPDIYIFPQNIRFSSLYPQTKSKMKVMISNSSLKEEVFSISYEGSDFFNVSPGKITVVSGGTEIINVSFFPKDIGLFYGIITITSGYLYKVKVSGECIPFFLEIPDVKSDFWCFRDNEFIKTIPFSNKSPLEELNIQCKSSLSSIVIEPSEFVLKPLTQKQVKISLSEPFKQNEGIFVSINCNNIKNAMNIPIRIGKNTHVIDFGKCSVGCIAFNHVFFEKSQNIDSIPLPFIYTECNRDKTEYIFSFNSNTPGCYKETIACDNIDLQLIGEAIEKPYSMNIRKENDHQIIEIVNLINDTIFGKIKYSIENEEKIIESIKIEHNMTKRIKLHSSKNGEVFPFLFEWNNSVHQDVNDIYSDFLEPNNTEIVDSEIEFESLNENHLNISPSVLIFPNVQSSSKPICVHIDSEKSYSVSAPEWISIDDDDSTSLVFKCNDINDPFQVSYIEIINDNQESMKIPVLAYNGKSEIQIPKEVILEYSEDDAKYHGSIQITNMGNISGFVAFNNQGMIKLSVDKMIISPNQTINVEVISVSIQNGSIIEYKFCDEIFREILSKQGINEYDISSASNLTYPDLSLFNSITIGDQLNEFIFDDQVYVNSEIPIQSKIIISPERVSCSLKEPSEISLINLSNEIISFSITPSTPTVIVQPLSGEIGPYEEFHVEIQLLNPVRSILRIDANNCQLNVPIDFNENTNISSTTLFTLDTDGIDFGACDFGSTKSASINIFNPSSASIEIDLSLETHSNDFKFCKKLKIEPHDHNLLNIKFNPRKKGLFTNRIRLSCNDQFTYVTLNGNCVSDESLFLTKKDIVFPSCTPGTMRRIHIKLTNKSSMSKEYSLITQKPFFTPLNRISISGNSDVIISLHFLPNKEGFFHEELEVMGEKKSIYHLYGDCSKK